MPLFLQAYPFLFRTTLDLNVDGWEYPVASFTEAIKVIAKSVRTLSWKFLVRTRIGIKAAIALGFCIYQLLCWEYSLSSWFGMRCVANMGTSLVEVAFVLAAWSHRHLSHESKVAIQMATSQVRNHPVMCTVVSLVAWPRRNFRL